MDYSFPILYIQKPKLFDCGFEFNVASTFNHAVKPSPLSLRLNKATRQEDVPSKSFVNNVLLDIILYNIPYMLTCLVRSL